MELGKLSVYHNIYNQKQPVATTLLGVGRMEILKLNMDIVTEGLTETEEQVLHEVIEQFFSDTNFTFKISLDHFQFRQKSLKGSFITHFHFIFEA